MPIAIKAQLKQEGAHSPHEGEAHSEHPASVTSEALQDTYYIRPVYQDQKTAQL